MDPWLPEEVSTKIFSLEKNPTKRSLTAWGSLYQKLLKKSSYQKISDCLNKSLPKASQEKFLPKDLWLPEEVSTKSFSRKVPTKRSLTAWTSLYQKLLKKSSYQKISDCLRKSLPKASQEKFLPKDLWLPEEVSTKSFSRKVPTKRSLTAWGSLYQKLLKKSSYQKISDCLRKSLQKKNFEETCSTKKMPAETSLQKKSLKRYSPPSFFSDETFYTHFFAETSLSKKLKRTPCPTQKKQKILTSLPKNLKRHYKKLSQDTCSTKNYQFQLNFMKNISANKSLEKKTGKKKHKFEEKIDRINLSKDISTSTSSKRILYQKRFWRKISTNWRRIFTKKQKKTTTT